jgi:hypothetical protein
VRMGNTPSLTGNSIRHGCKIKKTNRQSVVSDF